MRSDILEMFAELQGDYETQVETTLMERARYRKQYLADYHAAWAKRNRKRVSDYERERRRKIRTISSVR